MHGETVKSEISFIKVTDHSVLLISLADYNVVRKRQ